jgi:hypothetical protein
MLARSIVAIAAVVVLALAGCKTQEKRTSAPPSESAAITKAVQHAGLKAVESKIQEALEASSPGGAGAPASGPNFSAVFEGASQLARGADVILEDRPENLTDQERLQYEGLVAQLKEKAADLQAAAEHQKTDLARRSFAQATSSCVTCHVTFWKQD